MIGVGYIENNKWNYKVFTSSETTLNEEYKLFVDFTEFITNKSLQLDPSRIYIPRLFHWSQAEVTNFEHVNERYNGLWSNWGCSILWVDMYNVFVSEPIVIKGALSFKLKEIGKAMYDLNLISTLWNDIGPSDGLSAMISAIDYYKNKKNNTLDSKLKNIYNLIVDYNEIDCKVIWEIVTYLRNHRT